MNYLFLPLSFPSKCIKPKCLLLSKLVWSPRWLAVVIRVIQGEMERHHAPLGGLVCATFNVFPRNVLTSAWFGFIPDKHLLM